MEPQLNKIFTKGKCLFLAYDQGLEHGPTDFNDENINPRYILAIAQNSKFNAFICQKGIAEKYRKEIKASKIPLIIKLNGKTNLSHGEPLSTQLCTVEEALKFFEDIPDVSDRLSSLNDVGLGYLELGQSATTLSFC